MKKYLLGFLLCWILFIVVGCKHSISGDYNNNSKNQQSETENEEKQSQEDEFQIEDSNTFVKFVNHSSYSVSIYLDIPDENSLLFAEVAENDSVEKKISIRKKETESKNFFFEYNIPLGNGNQKYKYFLNGTDSQFRKTKPIYTDKINEIIIDELKIIDDKLETESAFLILKNESTSSIYLLANDEPINPYGRNDKYINTSEACFYEIGNKGQFSVESINRAELYINSNRSNLLNFSKIDFKPGNVYRILVKNGEVTLSSVTFFPTSGELCTVTFENPKSESDNRIVEIVQNKALTEKLLFIPTEIEGYTFTGWFTDNLKIESGKKVSSDITITANYEPIIYQIDYELNGCKNYVDNPTSYTIETDSIILAAPERLGYIFKGWYRKEDFSDSPITQIVNGSTGNVKLYAKWEIAKYSISYELNGGNNAKENPSVYTIGDTVNLSFPERKGYEFAGWFTTEDFSLDSEIKKIEKGSTGNKKIYAKWVVCAYKIDYILNTTENEWEKIINDNSYEYTAEDSIILRNPVRSGFLFKGWYTKEDFSDVHVTKIPSGSVGDKTFYAKWELEDYSISYELFGGVNSESNISSFNIFTNHHFNSPVKNGYDFTGWYLDRELKESVSDLKSVDVSNRLITGNLVLYAGWKPVEYSINYMNLQGGTSATVKSYTIENEILLYTPERKGALFVGWYDNPEYSGSAISKIFKGNYGEKTFYAKWSLINYSITYVLNGGSNSNENPVSYNITSDTITFEKAEKTDNAFLGWYTSADFTGNPITKIEHGSTGDFALYAKWDELSIVDVTVTDLPLSEITVTKSINEYMLTFIADDDFDEYKWEIDETVQTEETNILSINTQGWAQGTYEVRLEAKKGNKRRSAIFYIKVEVN